ncbi:hypothetical protein PS732_04254 [Pseudomonas fluorescens]|uniref:Uncharacterized protein n=1 Tax=Pseudomonas fluorescens TaxID=294 RepID=A0ABD7VKH9_PSEFL|nr:hypothetical protein PS732_04254 [Pseudomonas fluorescens]
MYIPYIEDTDDWVGTPTLLETCRHQLMMCENEIQECTLRPREERERIFTLAEFLIEATKERGALRDQLAKQL